MARFSDIFPGTETLLQLEPEDVGVLLLQYLNGLPVKGQRVHRHNLFTPDSDLMNYAGTKQLEVRALYCGTAIKTLRKSQRQAPAPNRRWSLCHFLTYILFGIVTIFWILAQHIKSCLSLFAFAVIVSTAFRVRWTQLSRQRSVDLKVQNPARV